MQINLDFCFADEAGRLAITGWTPQPQPQVFLQINGTARGPVEVQRHVRADLRTKEPYGFLILYDVSDLDLTAEGLTLRLAEGEEGADVTPERLAGDALRLVRTGVNEVYTALLSLIGQRHLTFSDAAIGREICARLRTISGAPSEHADYAVSADRCLTTAAGQGIVVGWHLGSQIRQDPLVALAVANDQVIPVDLMLNSLTRTDLSGYAERYRFTGRDGFCGSWAPVGDHSGTRLLLLVPSLTGLALVPMAVELVSMSELARQVSLASLSFEEDAQRLKLRRAILPKDLDMPAPVAGVVPVSAADGVTLLLDHDLPDTDLRDILRRFARHVQGDLRLQLLRERLTPALQTAINGAVQEMSCRLHVRVAPRITVPPECTGLVVFARSSALFQLDPAPLTRELSRAAITVLDPIGAVTGSGQDQLTRFRRDLLPFIMSVPAAAFFAMLEQTPACFLTEEARVRLVAESLMAQSGTAIFTADVQRYFEGTTGPNPSVWPMDATGMPLTHKAVS